MSQKTPFARRFLWGCWLAVIAALASSPPLRQLAVEQSRLGTSLDLSGTEFDSNGNRRAFPPPAVSSVLPYLPREPGKTTAWDWRSVRPKSAMEYAEAALSTESNAVSGSSGAMRRALDRALTRFPQEPWLYAARLRYTFGEFPQLGETLVDWGNTTEYRSSQVNLPAAVQVAASLEVARRGSELEPDNAFFDFCAALLHIQQNRADLAVRALESAGRKKGFDEHVLDETQARIALRRAQSPQTFEREMSISASTLFPQYAVMREGARRFVGEARRLEERGEHAQALRIYGALMNVGRGMSHGETLITSLVGRAIQAVAVARGRKAPTLTTPPPPGQSTSDVLRSMRRAAFTQYAVAHGRHDLAQAAGSDARINDALTRAQHSRDSTEAMGIPNTLLDKTTSLWRIGAALLLQIVLGLLVLAPTSTWRLRSRESEARVSGIDVACAALPPVVAVATCGWIAWGARSIESGSFQGSLPSGAVSPMAALSWGIALAPLPFIAVWCAAGSVRGQRHGLAGWRSRTGGSARDSDSEAGPSLLFQRVAAAVLGLGWLIVAALGAAWMIVDDPQVRAVAACVFPIELASVLALHAFLKRRDTFAAHSAREHGEPYLQDTHPMSCALERARRALCWTTALAALSWIALATYSLPLRAQAQAHLHEFMQEGEVTQLWQRAGL